jgi:hypothetical protein
MIIEIEIEIYLLSSHHRTVHQLTPGFCGAQVRYIFTNYLCMYVYWAYD